MMSLLIFACGFTLLLSVACYMKWTAHYPSFMSDEPVLQRVCLCVLNGFITYIFELQGANTPFLDTRHYKICSKLEGKFDRILDEVTQYLKTNRMKDVPTFDTIDNRNSNLSCHDNKSWKVIVFKYYRDYVANTCSEFPITSEILKSDPTINLAMLSVMEGGKKLYPHQGPFKGIARIHLAVTVPEPGAVLTVDNKPYKWVPGRCVAFDDTFEHSVHNKADSYRVVLFLDVMRHELPKWFSFIFSCSAASEYLDKVNKKIEMHAAHEM